MQTHGERAPEIENESESQVRKLKKHKRRCGEPVMMVPSDHMIAGSNRTCATIYK